jgi:hypothetical protein
MGVNNIPDAAADCAATPRRIGDSPPTLVGQPTTKTPVSGRPVLGHCIGHYAAANSLRSFFTNRDSFPLRAISRMIAL